ncbi:hypothetical protein [Methylomonas albis]|uniref:PD(D/E)XK endonuclease domain-containing protein n=1 Tax=Methylomonas albis TaxID=1854563 RepID=A0ABR9D513_9GAMM|nr:hypothetical protein [Methylomonas albis]MBD9358188.1 hypothetical protein [Methylomonas albis]
MKYIGKYSELLVLTKLLEQDFEAYLAIKVNQDDYDITVILENDRVVRIQVKSTDLNNTGTNNVINGIDKKYDYLILVVVNQVEKTRIFVMTKDEAINIKGSSKGLGVTRQEQKKFLVKDEFLAHEDKWQKLLDTA